MDGLDGSETLTHAELIHFGVVLKESEDCQSDTDKNDHPNGSRESFDCSEFQSVPVVLSEESKKYSAGSNPKLLLTDLAAASRTENSVIIVSVMCGMVSIDVRNKWHIARDWFSDLVPSPTK